jgi:P27 family predicted phage terminase small subunit
MVRGRKPKPPGMSTRRPDRLEQGPPAKLPPCPPHLAGEARKEWYRMGRRLLSYGLMSELDRGGLAIYCQAWARWVEAEGQLAKFGTVVVPPSGFPVQSPYLAIANKAMEQMTRILVEFGMSPSARSKVTVRPPRPQRTLPEEEDAPAPVEREDPRRYLRAVQ